MEALCSPAVKYAKVTGLIIASFSLNDGSKLSRLLMIPSSLDPSRLI